MASADEVRARVERVVDEVLTALEEETEVENHAGRKLRALKYFSFRDAAGREDSIRGASSSSPAPTLTAKSKRDISDLLKRILHREFSE